MKEQWAAVWLDVRVGMVCRLFPSKDAALEFIQTKLVAEGQYERAHLARVIESSDSPGTQEKT